MKKKLIAGAMAGAALLAMAAPLMAEKPPEVSKVEICHITDSWDIPAPNPFTTAIGQRISVSVNALPAHQAHGDFVYAPLFEIDNDPIIFGLTWRQVAENNGLDTTDAECAGFIPDL